MQRQWQWQPPRHPPRPSRPFLSQPTRNLVPSRQRAAMYVLRGSPVRWPFLCRPSAECRVQSAGPQPRSSSALSLLCDRVVGVSSLPGKLALGHVPRTTSQPPGSLSKPEACRGSRTRWLKSTQVFSTGYCTAASLPLPRVSLYLPCRLTAAHCSAGAVCAARLRSLYGAQQIPTGRYCK